LRRGQTVGHVVVIDGRVTIAGVQRATSRRWHRRFAGARGSAVEDFTHGVVDKKNKTFTGPIIVTFLP
jgi:hypothetical protein